MRHPKEIELARFVRALVDSLDQFSTYGVAVFDLSSRCVFCTETFQDLTGIEGAGDTSARGYEPQPFAEYRSARISKVGADGQSVLVGEVRSGIYLEAYYSCLAGRAEDDETFVMCAVTVGLSPFRQRSRPDLLCPFADWGALGAITVRQREVLAHLRSGSSQREIASVLGVSPKTVETHRDQLVRRLGVTTTIEAIRLADRAELTPETARLKSVSE